METKYFLVTEQNPNDFDCKNVGVIAAKTADELKDKIVVAGIDCFDDTDFQLGEFDAEQIFYSWYCYDVQFNTRHRYSGNLDVQQVNIF
jgi:hypothetical protein